MGSFGIESLASQIDWNRIAEPQADQYDTEVTLRLARRAAYQAYDVSGLPTCGDGAIALYHDGTEMAGAEPAPADHPNIAIALELIRLWPDVFVQCQKLLDYISPFSDPAVSADHVVGSSCGPAGNGFGSIAATVDHHVGFAEAIVHEMGHHKLRALGIGVDKAEHLITNAPDRLYRSPIRYDCQRPMSAVIHAQYSYTYVVALDLAILAAVLKPERDRCVAEHSIAVILPKLEFGRDVIEKHVEVDTNGSDFMTGFFGWIDAVVERGGKALDALGIPPRPFEHPLDGARSPGLASVQPPRPPAKPAATAILEDVWSGLTATPCKVPRIESHGVRDEMVLYCPDREAAYALNASSRSIWELCDGERSQGDISRALLAPLGCDDAELLEQLTQEIITTLHDFHSCGLITLSDTPGSGRA